MILRAWDMNIGVRRTIMCVLLLMANCLSGCVADQPVYEDDSPNVVRQIPAQPEGILVDQIGLHPGLYPKDTNGNGRGDRIELVLYLWSNTYAFPLHKDGMLTVSLYPMGQAEEVGIKPLRQWSYTGDALEAHRGRAAPGSCFFFNLSLRANSGGVTDDLGVHSADMIATFKTQDDRIISSGVSTLQFVH